jgi:hypothetical protein
MTVNELIEQLKNYPADMHVLTLGYEGGFDDIGLRTEDIVFGANSADQWYYGSHESVRFVNGGTGTKCLVIIRAK